jgi:hypothetical protein
MCADKIIYTTAGAKRCVPEPDEGRDAEDPRKKRTKEEAHQQDQLHRVALVKVEAMLLGQQGPTITPLQQAADLMDVSLAMAIASSDKLLQLLEEATTRDAQADVTVQMQAAYAGQPAAAAVTPQPHAGVLQPAKDGCSVGALIARMLPSSQEEGSQQAVDGSSPAGLLQAPPATSSASLPAEAGSAAATADDGAVVPPSPPLPVLPATPAAPAAQAAAPPVNKGSRAIIRSFR